MCTCMDFARAKGGRGTVARIAIVGGGGYVGLAYAAAFADLGHDVVGLDTDQGKIVALKAGRSTIYEPGLDDLLHRGLASRRLSFTTDYARALACAEFAFICVGTPPDEIGRADTTYVAAAARGIATHATRDLIVVNKSTMPVGSVDWWPNSRPRTPAPTVRVRGRLQSRVPAGRLGHPRLLQSRSHRPRRRPARTRRAGRRTLRPLTPPIIVTDLRARPR